MEIGSEFWLDRIPTEYIVENTVPKILDWIKFGEDQCLTFSGRTAIDYVLEDLSITQESNKSKKTAQVVYMPSYCCHSMLQPFLDRGIHIEFYDVVYNGDGMEYIIDYEKPCNIFFATSYFGFSSTTMDLVIEAFSKKGITVIEDVTHRLLNQQAYCIKADYSIGSLRKWLAIPSGGLAIKKQGNFSQQNLKKTSYLVEAKIAAMIKKADYLNKYGDENLAQDRDKQLFLTLFSEFNRGLDFDYKSIEIDDLSKQLLLIADIGAVKARRRDNANFLNDAFKGHQHVKPLVDIFDATMDCPLFFPVRVSSAIRADLRSYLIDNEIYCPIHWPIPNEPYLNTRTKKLYEEELSLICDQRYDIDDMARIINTIEAFWSKA